MDKKKKPVALSWEDFQALGNPSQENEEADDLNDIEGEDQIDKTKRIRISLERKGRKGKQVTIINGLTGSNKSMQELGKELKKLCGVGGSLKNDELILQGDQRKKIMQILGKQGFRDVKISGA